MVLPKETIATGAPRFCLTCQTTPRIAICTSAAGFYIGTYCNCGPYSRESGYYKSLDEARKALETGNYSR